jgi:hypothetical protein
LVLALLDVYAGQSLAAMKYHHLIRTLAFSLALSTIAIAKEKGTSADEATLKKIEQEILDGVLKSDTSVLEKYLTSDYLGIGPDGVTRISMARCLR